MLRYIKIASVVTAMVFYGISPAFAATPDETTPTQAVKAAVVHFDELSANTTEDSGPAASFYTMPNGEVEIGVLTSDGAWNAPTEDDDTFGTGDTDD